MSRCEGVLRCAGFAVAARTTTNGHLMMRDFWEQFVETALPHPQPQRPSFSTKIAAVRVDVSVTQRGKAVPNLTAQDFEVRDNGVLQPVDLATFEQVALNVRLALDLSHSVSGERLRDVKAAGQAVLDGMPPNDKPLLLTFNHAVLLREALTANLIGPICPRRR
jgi:hypothetical protein